MWIVKLALRRPYTFVVMALLILILGGLFLIWKSTSEIHQSMEGEETHASGAVKATFASVILQIMIIDLVFSLDMAEPGGVFEFNFAKRPEMKVL